MTPSLTLKYHHTNEMHNQINFLVKTPKGFAKRACIKRVFNYGKDSHELMFCGDDWRPMCRLNPKLLACIEVPKIHNRVTKKFFNIN